MDEQRKQPEGASHQAVGALIGALVGLGIAARQIFADYGEAAQVPWVEGIGITLGGGVAGLLLATLLGAGSQDETGTVPVEPAEVEDGGKNRIDPPGQDGTDSRIKPGHGINGIHRPDDPAKRA